MAYLREFQTKCQTAGCDRRAVVEVFGNRNASYGRFCRACGTAHVKRLTREEGESQSVQRVRP